MAQDNKPVISFDFRNDYTIKLEKPDQMWTSFFSEQYKHILFLIYKHISNITNFRTLTAEFNNVYQNPKDWVPHISCPNNIFPIMGDRGSGKSTFLNNISNVLAQLHKPPNNSILNNLNIDQNLHQCEWICMGIIDPTMLSKNANVIEILVAKLYENFKQIVNSGNISTSNKAEELYDNFKEVQDNLQAIYGDIRKYDNLSTDKLDRLASSTNLKTNLFKLIESYLKCVNDNKHKYLIIAIDDFDCNIGRTFELMDEVSKYLILPNVIILTTFKFEVMWDSVHTHMIKEREVLLKSKDNLEEPKDMASRYVEKLFPNSRWTVLYGFQTPKNAYNIRISEDKPGQDVNKYVVDMIFNKIGIMFRYTEGYLHEIIPINLRELRELILILKEMKNIYDLNTKTIGYQINYQNWMHNVIKFREYIIKDYAPSNLSKNYIDLINELIATPIQKKNFRLVCGLDDVLFHELIEQGRFEIYKQMNDDIYRRIVNRENTYDNISLGDVLYVLKICEKHITNTAFDLLLFVIKTLYTTVLIELFIDQSSNKTDESDFNDIQQLIGGSFVPIGQHILRDRNDRRHRDAFEVNIETIFTENQNFDPVTVLLLSLMIIPNRLNQNNYRSIRGRYYDQSFTSSTRYMFFNIFALLFNIFGTQKAKENYEDIMIKVNKDKTKTSKDNVLLNPDINQHYPLCLLPLINIEFIDYLYNINIKGFKKKKELEIDILIDYLKQLKSKINSWLDNYKHDKGETTLYNKIIEDTQHFEVFKYINSMMNERSTSKDKQIKPAGFVRLYGLLFENQVVENVITDVSIISIYNRMKNRKLRNIGTNNSVKDDISLIIRKLGNDEKNKEVVLKLNEMKERIKTGDKDAYKTIIPEVIETLKPYVDEANR